MGLMYTCTYMYVLLVYVYRGYSDLISNHIQASSVLLPLFSRDAEFLSLATDSEREKKLIDRS